MMYGRESLEPRGREFLRPRLRGVRFEDGAIPLEVLGDLAALRKMILEVAKWRFLEANPDRRRTPHDFNRIDLELTGISKGSAVPVISLMPDRTSPGSDPLPYYKFFEQARGDIVDTIGVANNIAQPEMRPRIPHRYLTRFKQIGRSLRDDESIEMFTPDRSYPARLTKYSRDLLIRWSSETETSWDVTFHEMTLRGVVSEADQARMTFGLQPVYGATVRGPIPEEYHEVIVTALGRYRHGDRVEVQGVGRYDKYHRPSKLESVKKGHLA